MPCCTIQTTSVVLKVANMELLKKALEALNLSPMFVDKDIIAFAWGQSFDRTKNELRLTDASLAAKIKQAYSAEIVKSQARRFGWQLKETAPFQYEVTKR